MLSPAVRGAFTTAPPHALLLVLYVVFIVAVVIVVVIVVVVVVVVGAVVGVAWRGVAPTQACAHRVPSSQCTFVPSLQ